jgi:MbtH protein
VRPVFIDSCCVIIRPCCNDQFFDNENGEFLVLVNEDRQHSLWPVFLDIPIGWKATGPKGDRKACLDWIDKTWTDMRPASLVRQMDEDARER